MAAGCLRPPATPHVSRRTGPGPRPGIGRVRSARRGGTRKIRIATAQLRVHDQDEALAFYTQKVGMEVRTDVTLPELGGFRWLTVAPPGQEDVTIVLMPVPGPPMMDDDTAHIRLTQVMMS